MNKIASLLAALALSIGVQFNAIAADPAAPDALVKGVTDDVIAIVRQDKAIQSGDTRKAVELVETRVLPYFDFAHMTRLAVGKDWKQASPEQKTVLTQEFKTLLVRTYSNALTQYRNQQIDFKPLKAKPEDTDVIVRTEVRQAGDHPSSTPASRRDGPSTATSRALGAGVSGREMSTTSSGSSASDTRKTCR